MVANHLRDRDPPTAALSIDDAATTRTALETIRENSVDGLADAPAHRGILRDSSGDIGAGRRAHLWTVSPRWSSTPCTNGARRRPHP
ncbi:hypothetical protein [Streptomyces sp. KL116D]|uniref:hypothetical protein n=1 Tax=Streptomyces sp. KL116D TaxID=3045152 RepID=UPI003557005D